MFNKKNTIKKTNYWKKEREKDIEMVANKKKEEEERNGQIKYKNAFNRLFSQTCFCPSLLYKAWVGKDVVG